MQVDIPDILSDIIEGAPPSEGELVERLTRRLAAMESALADVTAGKGKRGGKPGPKRQTRADLFFRMESLERPAWRKPWGIEYDPAQGIAEADIARTAEAYCLKCHYLYGGSFLWQRWDEPVEAWICPATFAERRAIDAAVLAGPDTAERSVLRKTERYRRFANGQDAAAHAAQLAAHYGRSDDPREG